MRFTVRSFRGCAAAEIDADKIVLIAGKNAQGKSSLLQALGAVLTRTPVPIGEPSSSAASGWSQAIPNKHAEILLHGSSADGIARAIGKTNEDVALLSWPDCKCAERGVAPKASHIAAGLVQPSALATEALLAQLVTLLGAVPTREDYDKATKDTGVAPAYLDDTWTRIQSGGWQAAAAKVVEGRAKVKGSWETHTKRNWSSSSAGSWTPDGWTDDLNSCTEDQLESELDAAAAALRECSAGSIVSEHALAELRACAEGLPAAKEALKVSTIALENARQFAREARHDRDSLPEVEGESGYTCPHCSGALGIKRAASGAITITKFAAAATLEENAQRSAAIKTANDKVRRSEQDVSDAIGAQALAQKKVTEAEEAAKKVNDALIGADDEAAKREAAEAAALLAERRHTMFKVRAAAHKCAKSVAAASALLDVLRPDGVRKLVLSAKLKAFNEELAKLAASANWQTVSITDSAEITIGGRNILICSESEIWRANSIIQIAIACRDGSSCIIMDRADILTADGRNGLFAMLKTISTKAIVAMSAGMPDSKAVPDLSRFDLGKTYWIERGIVTPLAEATKKK